MSTPEEEIDAFTEIIEFVEKIPALELNGYNSTTYTNGNPSVYYCMVVKNTVKNIVHVKMHHSWCLENAKKPVEVWMLAELKEIYDIKTAYINSIPHCLLPREATIFLQDLEKRVERLPEDSEFFN